MDNLKQTRVLPFWGNGEDPGTSEMKAAPDRRGFTDILKIFVRTWPYLIPQIVGYWHEIPRRTAADLDGEDAQVSQGSETPTREELPPTAAAPAWTISSPNCRRSR